MPEYDLWIRNVAILLPDFSICFNANIGIQGTTIQEIWPTADDKPDIYAKQVIDGHGKLAMPGLVDAHTHVCQQLLRGGVVDEMPMIWSRILVPFENALTPEDVAAGARLFCVECLKAGVTTIGEAGGRYMQAAAEVILEAGLRACLARSTMDQGDFLPQNMKETPQEAVTQTEKLFSKYHGAGDDRIHVWFALRQVMSSSPELVKQIGEHARRLNTGVHMHLAEHLDEVGYCLKTYGLRPAEWLDSLGLLGLNLLTAHAVRLCDREVKLLADRGVHIVHCPRSNVNHQGFTKTPLFLTLGANIGLGTDGASGWRIDLFEQMRLLKSAMQARFGLEINDPLVLPAVETLKMATRGGANALLLGNRIGTIEEGKHADLILVQINKSHIYPTLNLPSTLVMAAGPDDVADVIIDGRLLMKDRVLLHLDEEAIRCEAGKAIERVAKRAGLKTNFLYS